MMSTSRCDRCQPIKEQFTSHFWRLHHGFEARLGTASRARCGDVELCRRPISSTRISRARWIALRFAGAGVLCEAWLSGIDLARPKRVLGDLSRVVAGCRRPLPPDARRELTMAKMPFAFHAVRAEWGGQLPDGDYTIGRGPDPRPMEERQPPSGEDSSDTANTNDQRAATEIAQDKRSTAAE